MIKLIKSEDSFLLNNTLLNELQNKKDSIKYYNSIYNILIDINQIKIFENDDIKVIKNDEVFANLDAFKQNQKILEQLLNIDETIYFITNARISSAREIKEFLKNIEIINIDGINQNNITYYIENKLKEFNISISNQLIQKISSKLICDANVINLELSKLVNTTNIDEYLIDKLICDWQSSNVFDLVNLILKKDKKNILKLYDSLIKQNYDEYALIQILASQLMKLVMQKNLIKMGYSLNQICEVMKANQFILTKNNILLKNVSLEELNQICDELYQLDIKIKLSLIDKNKSLKYFLLKL